MRHPRIIGNDEEKLPAALEGADKLRPVPFQHTDHGTGRRPGGFLPQTRGADVAADQHAIFVQRGGRGILRNGDLLQRRVVRLQKSFALPVHANPAGDQVRFPRQNVAVALDAGEAASLFVLPQHLLQFLLLPGREAEGGQEFRDVEWEIVRLAQQPGEFFGESFHVKAGVCARFGVGGKQESPGRERGAFVVERPGLLKEVVIAPLVGGDLAVFHV